MLYGSVRSLNHHSHFGFHLSAFRMGSLGFILGNDTRKKTTLAILSQWDYFCSEFLSMDRAYIRPYKSSPYVLAVLQVSILNGTDLTNMTEYTGEQVSPKTPT